MCLNLECSGFRVANVMLRKLDKLSDGGNSHSGPPHHSPCTHKNGDLFPWMEVGSKALAWRLYTIMKQIHVWLAVRPTQNSLLVRPLAWDHQSKRKSRKTMLPLTRKGTSDQPP